VGCGGALLDADGGEPQNCVMITDWIQAARPKTLGAAVAPVAAGSVLGWKLGGAWNWTLFACTLGSCIALQVATNWFNDALDFLKGADTRARLGPRRITAAGVVPPGAVLRAAWLMLGVAALLSLPLLSARGWPVIAIGVPSLYFCFGYTGGPWPLAYRGLGELFVVLFFGFVAVAGSAFVQSGQWHAGAILAGFQIGCLSTILIAINNLRDMDEDRSTGKLTLAARFGPRFARWEITLLILLPHAAGAAWCLAGKAQAFVLPLLAAPAGLVILRRVWTTPPGPDYNRLLALGGAQLLAFALLFCLGLDGADG